MRQIALIVPHISLPAGRYACLLGCLAWLISVPLKAQQSFSNLRRNSFTVFSDTTRLDTFSVIPHTLKLTTNGSAIDSTTYDWYPFAGLLIWKTRPQGKVDALYRVYPYALANRSFNKSFEAYRRTQINRLNKPFEYTPEETSADKFIDFGALDYSGNLSRGLSFGSNQDVVLNSSFNLQLQGMLSKDIEVTAAITDNNIPIQPEGNTQQIQEFDKIFIQLRKGRHAVVVGDFDLFNGNDYFLRYSKKTQGGGYTGSVDLKKFGTLKAHVAGGIAKGKFSRNILANTEGNQGPYKLTGANGESLIIILANTEEVFINGQKLKRGADNDYIIDYNLGTITFMPRRIITKDLRVVVEFEYSERNYQRTMVDGALEWETRKSSIRFNAYSEQDSKNQNIQQSLNADKKNFLAAIGDSVNNAFYPGVDTASFDANRILYEMRDTICGSRRDTFYVYSVNPATARYVLTFAQVPVGRYKAAENTANGRTYTYSVSIDTTTCQFTPTGNYEPVIKLVAPQLQQMFTLAGDYRFNTRNKMSAEVALSNTDLNTLSNKNDNNNLGLAARAGYSSEIVTKRDSQNVKQQLNLDFNYEFLQNTFRTIERYRTVEFARDFNLPVSTLTHNEHGASMNATYSFMGFGAVHYRLRAFFQDTAYKGYEHLIDARGKTEKWQFDLGTTVLHSSATGNKTLFIRPFGHLGYTLPRTKGWRASVGFNHEMNWYRDLPADTLNKNNSRLWQNYSFAIQNADSQQNSYKLEYLFRSEQVAGQQTFERPHRLAHTITVSGTVTTLKNQSLSWNLTYRRVDEKDSIKAASELKNYYLGRVDYSFYVLKGLFKSQTYYEIGAGREQRAQLQYIQALNRESGEYAWRDVNGDSIKQLNEFYPIDYRNYSGPVFFRSFVFTPDYIAVNSAQFNEVLHINPAGILRNASGFGKVVKLFSLMTSLQLTRKIYARANVNPGEFFNPFPTKIIDTNIVALALTSRNSLFFNRTSAKFNAQFDVNYSRNRTLLTAGFENRMNQQIGLSYRWNIYKQLNWNAAYAYQIKENLSDFVKTQQYRIYSQDVNTELSYLFQQQIRLAASYGYSFKTNRLPESGGQFAVVNQTSVDIKYTRVQKTNLGVKLTYTGVGYADQAYKNDQAQYAMLEGLRNGNNFSWNVTLEQKLLGALQLIASYDGRKNGTNAIVHTARMELRAIF
ncbi:MAG: hypothetical protein U0T84_10315 [Chitinophagales bacterium]